MCGLPNWLEVLLEHDDRPSYRITMQGQTLIYETWQGANRRRESLQPSPQRWRDFLTALEAADLWQWAPQYRASCAGTIGTRWYIEIAAPFRQMNTGGDDAFPAGEAFPIFCAAMRDLLGGRAFA